MNHIVSNSLYKLTTYCVENPRTAASIAIPLGGALTYTVNSIFGKALSNKIKEPRLSRRILHVSLPSLFPLFFITTLGLTRGKIENIRKLDVVITSLFAITMSVAVDFLRTIVVELFEHRMRQFTPLFVIDPKGFLRIHVAQYLFWLSVVGAAVPGSFLRDTVTKYPGYWVSACCSIYLIPKDLQRNVDRITDPKNLTVSQKLKRIAMSAFTLFACIIPGALTTKSIQREFQSLGSKEGIYAIKQLVLKGISSAAIIHLFAEVTRNFVLYVDKKD